MQQASVSTKGIMHYGRISPSLALSLSFHLSDISSFFYVYVAWNVLYEKVYCTEYPTGMRLIFGVEALHGFTLMSLGIRIIRFFRCGNID